MNMKAEVRQQLVGNMIIGRCEAEPRIVFQQNLSSGTRCIRFSTDTIELLFPSSSRKTGAWKTGKKAQYEIYNDGLTLRFQLSISSAGLTKNQHQDLIHLIRSAKADDQPDSKGIIPIRTWIYTIGQDVQTSGDIVSEFFDYEFPFFETELRAWKMNPVHVIRSFPDVDSLTEGAESIDLSTRFERNKAARKKCIAHYGTACQICGFDFGEVYGAAFSGKIEVHHIVPLSDIREDYEVDPIHDLIPVCSNCHTALHSKKDGVYTPEELRNMLACSN